MAGAPIKAFISYAREDENFVRRLQGTLESRGIDLWVDRSRLEGGDEFVRRIEYAIERANCLIVILTPESVQSRWVRKEILYAQQMERRVIPLMVRRTEIPILLADIQLISFTMDYDEGVQELLVTLYHRVKEHRHESGLMNDERSQHPRLVAEDGLKDDNAPIQLVPPVSQRAAPAPDLNLLYQAGVTAKETGDLEQANVLWKEILDRDRRFRGGLVQEEFTKLQPELHASRVQKLRERIEEAKRNKQWLDTVVALQALVELDPHDKSIGEELLEMLRYQARESHRVGRWTEAIASWNEILRHNRGDLEAEQYLKDANLNREVAPFYEDARLFMREQKPELARRQLEMLYERTSTYGDPNGIAAALGMTVQHTLVEQERMAEEERDKRYGLLQVEHADLDREIGQARKTEERLKDQIDDLRSQQARIERDIRELDSEWETRWFAGLLVEKSASSWSAIANGGVYLGGGILLTALVFVVLHLVSLATGPGNWVDSAIIPVLGICPAISIVVGVMVGLAVRASVNTYQEQRDALHHKLKTSNFDKRLRELRAKREATRQRISDLNGKLKALNQEIKTNSPTHNRVTRFNRLLVRIRGLVQR